MATKPVFSGSSTADVQAYKQQLLDYYVQSGDTSPTVVSDIKYGNLNYGNINKAGTLEYSLYNPVATAKTSTGLAEANQIFSSATGKQLTGDGLVAVEGALRQGYSATDALKNLGDLSNYAKFSTDYNGGTTGGPAGPAGTDFSQSPGFWEASPGVTTPQQAAQPLQVIPNQFQGYQGGNATTSSIVDYLGSLGKATDFASRKALAEQAGIANYTGTAAQNTQLLGMLRGSTPASSVITPSSLESAKGVTLPGVQTGTLNQADAVVAGAGTTIAELIKQLTPPETEANKKEQSLLDQMAALTGDFGNKGADQAAAEAAAGLPQLKQQMADINAQILAKTAEYNVLQTANANKPITLNSIIGNERAILNAKAADIGLLEAQGLGLQGKISAAQDSVNRAIDLKYSTIEAKLNLYQAQLQALQPTLDKEERIRAQAQQILVDRQNQAITEAKQAEKDEKNYLLDLMSKYPDAGIDFSDDFSSAQTKVSGSRIYQQATRLVGGGTGTRTSSSSGSGSGVRTSGTGGNIDVSRLSPLAKQIYSNPAILDNLTPTEKGKVLKELSSAGLDLNKFAVENVNAGQRDQIAQYDDLIRQGQEAEVLLKETKLNTGPVASRVSALRALGGGAQDFTRYRSIIDNMGSALLKLRSGAAVTPQEFERIKGFIPGVNDDEKTAKTKIEKFYVELQKAQENYVKRATQTENQLLDSVSKISPDPLNINKSTDPLGIF